MFRQYVIRSMGYGVYVVTHADDGPSPTREEYEEAARMQGVDVVAVELSVDRAYVAGSEGREPCEHELTMALEEPGFDACTDPVLQVRRTMLRGRSGDARGQGR